MSKTVVHFQTTWNSYWYMYKTKVIPLYNCSTFLFIQKEDQVFEHVSIIQQFNSAVCKCKATSRPQFYKLILHPCSRKARIYNVRVSYWKCKVKMLAQSKFLFPNSVSFPSFTLALHFFVSGSEVCPWVIIADTPKPTLHTGPFNSFHFSSLQASLCAAIMNDQGTAACHRELSLSLSPALSLSSRRLTHASLTIISPRVFPLPIYSISPHRQFI